jgi:hypothetical protein
MRRAAVSTIRSSVIELVLGLVVVVSCVGVAGCGSGSGSGAGGDADDTPAANQETTSTSTTTSPSSSSTTTPMTEEEAILAAVDGFIASTFVVNDPPDPAHPDLARYRTGEVLVAATRNVEENRAQQISYRLPPQAEYRHQATVLMSDGTEATVRNCVVDDAIQVHADGRVVDSAVVTKLFAMRLNRVDGHWKVAENRTLDRWEGVAGCAVAG